MNNASFQFENARYLWWALLLLPFVWVMTVRTRAEIGRRGLMASLIVRSLWIVLCLLAVAAPGMRRPSEHEMTPKIVLLQDASQSVLADTDIEGHKSVLLHALGPNADVSEMKFAARPWVGGESNEANETNIEAALDAVNMQNLSSPDLRVIVLSDGRSTRGSATDAAERLAMRGAVVNAMPIGVAQQTGLHVVRAEPPVDAHVGMAGTVRVTLASSKASRVRLELVDAKDAVVDHREIPVQGEKTVILHFTPADPGVQKYTVRATELAANGKAESKRLSVYVGSPPRILIVDNFPDEMQAFRKALSPLKVPVDLVTPDNWPDDLSDYAAIVASDWSGKELTDDQRHGLRKFVEKQGGGLVFIGGGNVQPSRWDVNPLAELLPVKLQEKPKQVIKKPPEVAVVFVVDHSGSMQEGLPGGAGQPMSKIDLVKQAIITSVSSMPPNATVGLVSFDNTPTRVVEPTPVKKLQEITDKVDQIQVGGGTVMEPAIREGLSMLSQMHGDKYLVVLTDGIAERPSSDAGFWGGVASDALKAHVSWTSIAVGTDADQGLLQFLATTAHGKYHYCDTADKVPQVFMQAALTIRRFAERKERPFQPRAGPAIDSLKDMSPSDLPELTGRLRAAAKDQVDTVLLSETEDPLLASWHFGLGRVVAFTSDAKGGWARDWVTWTRYSDFWLQQVQGVMRTNAGLHAKVRAHTDGTRATFNYQVTGTRGEPIIELKCDGNFSSEKQSDKPAIPMEWKQVAPGEYQATAEVPGDGTPYLAMMNLAAGQSKTIHYAAIVSAQPSTEMLETGPDLQALSAITDAGNGVCTTDVTRLAAECTRTETRTIVQSTPLWPMIIILSLLLWPVDLVVRKYL